uniref:Uncharacterized protein n=1 Tax=uncultured Armatimonadetes bacterium TaxID=157466 RepID=A0A6J4JZ74_9BACT|nr:hypothetical protein AVDCRST_MAG63-4389 [uncultured Armatimonadetes bacterium]
MERFERLAPFGGVGEQDGDAALLAGSDGQGVHVEPAPHGGRVALETRGLARQGHGPVGAEPELVQVRDESAGRPAEGVGEARVPLERGVDLDEAVVPRLAPRVQEHLHDAEALVDGAEEGSVPLLAQGEPRLGLVLARGVTQDFGEPHGLARLPARQPLQHPVGPEAGAVPALAPAHARGAALARGGGEFLFGHPRRPVFGGEEESGGPAEHVALLVAQDAPRPLVPARDPPVGADQEQGVVGHPLGQRTGRFVRAAEGGLLRRGHRPALSSAARFLGWARRGTSQGAVRVGRRSMCVVATLIV